MNNVKCDKQVEDIAIPKISDFQTCLTELQSRFLLTYKTWVPTAHNSHNHNSSLIIIYTNKMIKFSRFISECRF